MELLNIFSALLGVTRDFLLVITLIDYLSHKGR